MNVSAYGIMMFADLYNQPRGSFSRFINNVSDLLKMLQGKRASVSGDFNILITDCFWSYSQDYTNLFLSHGFVNTIDLSTFTSCTNHMEISCLNLVWNNISIACSICVLRPFLSDHVFVAIVF